MVAPSISRSVRFPSRIWEIDFEELARRKQAEFDKLEAVIDFARTGGCRQRVILEYFGESDAKPCGSCDRCRSAAGVNQADAAADPQQQQLDNELLTRGIQVVLSGVKRMHGRFGKNMVAQMLCGSKNKKLQQWKLHRLSTYGLLSGLRQTEVVAVMDALIETGLLEQKEVDQRRPTVLITGQGERVMMSQEPIPASIRLAYPLAKRLTIAASQIESGDVQTKSAGSDPTTATNASATEASGGATRTSAATDALVEALKRWRRKTSAALGIPAYRVLTNATVQRVAEVAPQTTDQLEAIPGIGPATMEQFGYDIIELICVLNSSEPATPPPEKKTTDLGDSAHLQDRPAADVECPSTGASQPATLTSKRVDPGSTEIIATAPATANNNQPQRTVETGRSEIDDAYWTWRLFSDGYTQDQVAAIRRCEAKDLAVDLSRAQSLGHQIDPTWLDIARDGGEFSDQRAISPPSSALGGLVTFRFCHYNWAETRVNRNASHRSRVWQSASGTGPGSITPPKGRKCKIIRTTTTREDQTPNRGRIPIRRRTLTDARSLRPAVATTIC